MSWREYWSGETSLYVDEVHKRVHYDHVARDIVAMLPGPATRLLDWGCGEALAAERVAGACRHLYLCDAATSIRERLQSRLGQRANVTILAPEETATLPDGGLDMVLINSVSQYLTPAELGERLQHFAGKLAPGGAVVVADVVPNGVGPLRDAMALLRYGAANGFLLAALIGLVRTFLSDYRKKRAELGLTHYSPVELEALLARHGFSGERQATNVGHNPHRFTVIATPVARVDG